MVFLPLSVLFRAPKKTRVIQARTSPLFFSFPSHTAFSRHGSSRLVPRTLPVFVLAASFTQAHTVRLTPFLLYGFVQARNASLLPVCYRHGVLSTVCRFPTGGSFLGLMQKTSVDFLQAFFTSIPKTLTFFCIEEE